MIPYHGTPITPESAAAEVLAGRHGFVSHAAPQSICICAEVCQSFAVDNGAFSAWKSGKPIVNWAPFYEWLSGWQFHPSFDWFLIPDVIDGTESDNDDLIAQCPIPAAGVPIWHMHESLERLRMLANGWPRIALGSSGSYRTVGTPGWHQRMAEAMAVVCDSAGRPRTKLHGLRMLNPAIFEKFPFSSADSTNVARNMNIHQRWKGTYTPATAAARGIVIAQRIEIHNSAAQWISDFDRAILQAERLDNDRFQAI